jgi:hypothetical protein
MPGRRPKAAPRSDDPARRAARGDERRRSDRLTHGGGRRRRSATGICFETMMHDKVRCLGYTPGPRHSIQPTEVARLATERARKRAKNQLIWVIAVSIAVSAGLWTLLSALP